MKTIFESRYNGPHLRGTPFYAVLDNHYHYGNALARVEYARLNKGSGQWRMDDLYYRRDLGQTEDGRVLMRIVFRLSEQPIKF
ncbi:MAG: hypothetical protein O7C75_19270 [Verrucomicrobia bacterium]|nr:hypothetical protein [Verrucomicrobiota bacterium]